MLVYIPRIAAAFDTMQNHYSTYSNANLANLGLPAPPVPPDALYGEFRREQGEPDGAFHRALDEHPQRNGASERDGFGHGAEVGGKA